VKITAFFTRKGSFILFSSIRIDLSTLVGLSAILSPFPCSRLCYYAKFFFSRSRYSTLLIYSLFAMNTELSLYFSGSDMAFSLISSMPHERNFIKPSAAILSPFNIFAIPFAIFIIGLPPMMPPYNARFVLVFSLLLSSKSL